MAKSIRYKITQIENVVVFHAIEGSHELEMLLLEKYKSHRHASVTIPKLCMTFPLANADKVEERVNEIHAAIHKEFAGEWEPEKHEMVKDSESFTWEYLAKDEKTGVHICIQRIESDSPDAFVRREMVFPMTRVEIPTGPCEVCYGIEGCEDGVQVEPRSDLDDLLYDFGNPAIPSREYDRLEEAIKAIANKEKPVISLDIGTVESSWDASRSFLAEIKRQMVNQGVDFDWIGGGE